MRIFGKKEEEKNDIKDDIKDVAVELLEMLEMVQTHEKKIAILEKMVKIVTILTTKVDNLEKEVVVLKKEISNFTGTEAPTVSYDTTFTLEEIIIAVKKQFTKGHQAQDIICSIGSSAEDNGNLTINEKYETGIGITDRDIIQGMQKVKIEGYKIANLRAYLRERKYGRDI